jgi:large subunit ribosomal protein L29
MKLEDIRNLSTDEIDNEVERLRDQLFHLRTQAVTEKLQDPTQLNKAKRTIARLLTIKRQRAAASAS